MVRIISLLASLVLAGCADFYSNGHYDGGAHDSYERTDIDELLKFGGDFANQSAAFRADECRQLLKREKKNSSPGVVLHLMMGRLLSDACGDIPKLLRAVSAIPPSSLHGIQAQRLVDFNTEALKRIASQPGKSVAAGSTGARKGKGGSESDSGSDDAKMLREKLDAIRSIEKKLDEKSAE